MEITYKIALIAHIISGFTALFSGCIAIISQKGKKVHRNSGLIFFFSMLVVCVSATLISLLKHNQFLLHIGIFSFFLVYSGYRSVINKSLLPNALDWCVLGIVIINCIIMLFSAKIVLIVFGGIGSFLAIRDAKLLYSIYKKKEIPKNVWLIRHIGMMLGGYIATFTAFLVVNITIESLPWLPWLLPTIIGVPLIAFWTKKYQPTKQAV
jgi:hypothetical protein